MPSCIRHSSWIAAAALALISTASTFGQAPPEVLSAVPIGAAGRVAPPPGTFAFAFQDQAGHADINAVSIDIAPGLNSLSSMGACFLYFRPSDNQLYLADDGGVWMPPRTLGTAGILQNSQCAIDTGLSTVAPAAPSVSPTATTLTLHLALTFKAALVGANTVNLLAYGPISDSGWQDMGTWTVGPDHLPSAVSVSPTNPPGASQTFTFVYADSDTPHDISAVSVDFASSLTSVGACYLYFRLSDQQLYLADDAGAWMAPVTPGSAGTLQNHQCAVAAAGSSFSVSPSAGTLTVNLALSFTASFAGSKQVWMKPDETTGGAAWAQIATVTIPLPSALSVSLTHVGDFMQGQNGAFYLVTVTNDASAGPTASVVTVTENLPIGMSLASITGTGWTCSGTICTRNDTRTGQRLSSLTG